MGLVVSRFHLQRRMTPKAGDFIVPDGILNMGGGEAISVNMLYALPFSLETPLSFDRIGMYSDGVGGAGARARIGVGTMLNGRPHTTLLGSGELNIEVGTGDKVENITLTLSAGEYCMLLITNDAAALFRNASSQSQMHFQGRTTMDYMLTMRAAQAYGAIPGDISGLAWDFFYRSYAITLRKA